MSPRLRLLALIVAVEIVFAAVFFAARDDRGGPDVAADRRRTTTTDRVGADPTIDPGTITSLSAPTTALPAATTTTRRPTATTGRGTTQPPTTAAAVVDRVAVQQVATLSQPVAMAMRPGDNGTMYVAEQGGRVRALTISGSGATVNPGNVLDISGRITAGGEQGLLGIAFAPGGGQLYAYYTDLTGDIRVSEFPFADGRANAGAERVVLGVTHQPNSNHNGGQIVFGPDQLLYIGLGDGGGGGDPQGNGQDRDSLLGKILRIDPRAAGSQAYTVPSSNPFVGQSGARPEIWHYGLRNPWRFSFDRLSGEQWIADVGQNAWEEVNHVGAGRGGVNFGWNAREGKHSYNGAAAPPGAVDPEYELSHSAGNCSITGGFVYRGATIRGLGGTYVFADYCRGRLIGAAGGAMRDLGPTVPSPSSFGEDAGGEMWVLSLSGGVYRIGRGA